MAEALRAVGARVELQASAAQQWVHLLPTGTWKGADGRGPYLLNDPDAVIAATLPGTGYRPLPVDYDHAMVFAAPRGERSPAAGWIERLESRDDGIWGLVEWTQAAGKALEAKEYRYISPVLQHDKQGRVLRLVGAGLTNTPNFEQLAAVASQETAMDLDKLLAELRTALGLKSDADAAALTAAAGAAAQSAKAAGAVATAVASIAAAAGLPETAKPDEIATAVAALKAPPDPAKFVPIAEHQAVVARVVRLEEADADEKATAAVDAAVKAGKITPAGRDWALGYAKKDLAGFAAFAKAQPVIVAPGEIEALNRRPADADAALTDAERAVCAATGVTEEVFRASRKQIQEARK